MKNLKIVLAFFLILCLFFPASPVDAGLFASKTEKAQEKINKALGYLEIELTDNATNLFKEAKADATGVLAEDSKDNQALFVLAQANYFLGDSATAEKQIKKAFARDSSLGENIYSFYNQLADLNTSAKDPRPMISYKMIACKYKAGERTALAESFFRDGSKKLFSGYYHAAAEFYKAAYSLNPGYRLPITKAILQSAEQISDPCAQMILYRYSLDYSPANMHPQIFQNAAVVLKNCREQSVKNQFQLIRKEYRVVIYRLAYPPDYKTYQRGNHTLPPLKAGEETEKWIQLPNGVYFDISSSDNKFKLKYPDGELISAWTANYLPNKSKFKVIAVTDQPKIELKIN